MSSGRDPWADPDTSTEPGAPYAGPPTTAPPGAGWAAPGYGPPGYGPPGYGPPGYGPPGYGPPGYGAPGSAPYGYPQPGYGYPAPWPVVPRGPRRSGQVVASAVLAFVQAAMVIFASLYVWFFASIATVATAGAPASFDAQSLATEGTVLAAVQVVSAVLLVTAGVLALNRRGRTTWLLLVAAHALQIVLSLYWLVRLLSFADAASGPADIDSVLATSTVFFAAGPLVGLGLVVVGAGRRWLADEDSATPATGAAAKS